MSRLIIISANIDYYYQYLNFIHGQYVRLKDRTIRNVAGVSKCRTQLLVTTMDDQDEKPVGMVNIERDVTVIGNDLPRLQKWIDFNDSDEACYHCKHLMAFTHGTGHYHLFTCNVCGHQKKSY